VSGLAVSRLERDSDRNKLTDAELYLSQQGQKLVIFDEVQRRPELFRLAQPGRMSAFGRRTGWSLSRVRLGVTRFAAAVVGELAGRIAYWNLNLLSDLS